MHKRLVMGTMISVVLLVAAAPAMAQAVDLQQRFAAMKQAAVLNKQGLSQYQWTEITQVAVKGDPKPDVQDLCRYGPDGQVQKTLVTPPPPPPSGGGMKQKIIEKKTAEIKEYMAKVQALMSLYLPPDPQKMEQVAQAGKMALSPAGDDVSIIFTDYAQRGDRMAIFFDPVANKLISINIKTYLGEAKDVVTMKVSMHRLPDGLDYVYETNLDATAKQFVTTTTSLNFQKLGGS
jgi:hypothetical protein